MLKKYTRKLFFLVLMILVFPVPARSDVGIPMIFLGLPFALILLIPVSLIESIIYSKQLKIRYAKTIKPAIISNLISTLVGYPLSWVLLFVVEVLTTHGNVYNISTTIGKIVSVTLQAAWLIPFENELRWMVPTAGVFGLIPAYFISVKIEYYLLKKYFWKDLVVLNSIVYRANLYSYLLLFLILMIILAKNLIQ